MIIRYSKSIVKVGHASGAVFFGLIAAYVFTKGYWIWSFLIGLQCCGYVQAFSKPEGRTWSYNFKVAVLAIKSMPWTIRAGVLLSAVQTAWILLSAIAAVGWMASFLVVIAPDGAIHRASLCRDVSSSDGGDRLTVSSECDVGVPARYPSSCVYESGLGTLPLVYGVWLVSLTWGVFVIQNLVTATAAGAVASWCFSPPGNTSGAHNALYRATQSSFGSLCKAAVVTPVIRMWRRVSCFWQPPRHDFLAHPPDALDFSDVYVICFIGIYGLSCSDAHRRVPHLFNLRGMLHFTPNEYVVNNGVAGLGFAAVSLHVATAFLLSTVVSAMAGTHLSGFFGTAFGFFVCGFSLVTYTMFTAVEVLLSGMRAVLVCDLQDMEAIPANHGYRM
ncbi:unnamed protein product [Scytosiphon promiscuus]